MELNIKTRLLLLIRDLIRKLGYEVNYIGSNTPLESYIYKLYKKDHNIEFLQIGANDGIGYDPIYNIVNKLQLKGCLIEPVPQYFEDLKLNYVNNKNVTLINYAIYESDQKVDMFIYEDDEAPKWTKGIASLNNEHYKRTNMNKDKLKKVVVDGITFQSLFQKFQIDNIDLLVIDTEGYDYNILKLFPFDKFKPKIIQFEHNISYNVMTPEQFSEIVTSLVQMGYNVNTDTSDCIALLDFG